MKPQNRRFSNFCYFEIAVISLRSDGWTCCWIVSRLGLRRLLFIDLIIVMNLGFSIHSHVCKLARCYYVVLCRCSGLFFFHFFSFDCYSGPTPFPPDSPATWPVPLPCGVHQRYAMKSRTGRDCIEGIPPGTISAAFVQRATQLDQVRVHSDEFATGTVRRVVVSQGKGCGVPE